MPVIISQDLPAVNILKEEFIFLNNPKNKIERPLEIVILNIMPIKIDTETDFVRLFSNNPIEINLTFIHLETHESKNTSKEHLELFYKKFSDIKDLCFDGMIITGAPVEMMKFEDVNYWDEMQAIFDWANRNVMSTIYICWAAQAALYHFWSINKEVLSSKLFGIFSQQIRDKSCPLFRGFDDSFNIPHSRHTTISEEYTQNSEIKVLAESNETGPSILMARNGRDFFFTGHSEYSRYTLHNEFIRDLNKGLNINIPKNYYPNDDYLQAPILTWSAHANLLFNNWINYFVCQQTNLNP